MYKQDIIDNKDRKTNEKQQRILEEKKYLERMNQQFEDDRSKKQNQKTMLVNQRMEEYQNYMNVKSNNKKGNFSRHENVNDFNGNQEDNHNNLPHIPIQANEENLNQINHNSYKSAENINQDHYNSVDPYQNVENYNSNIYANQTYENSNVNNYSTNPYPDNNTNINNNNNYIPNINNNYPSNNQSNPHKDSGSHNPQLTLTDYNASMKNRKYEQQQAYKNYLDSQVTTNRSNRSQSSARAYENNRVIPQKKSNEPKVNPFSSKNYEFGSSALGHNPILNPTNNYGYNKYITSNNGKFQRAASNIIG